MNGTLLLGKGENAFVEIVDQDSAGSYAWLAAGRFSVPGLNPSEQLGDRQLACQVIDDFGLQRLHEDVMRLLRSTKSNQLRSRLCQTLIQLNHDLKGRSIFDVGAKLASTSGIHDAAENRLVNAIVEFDRESMQELIMKSMRTMSIGEQESLADLLSADGEGTRYLLQLLEAGTVSTAVLRNATVLAKLRTHQRGELNSKIDQLVARIPDTNPELDKLIMRRKQLLMASDVNVEEGRKVFVKNCCQLSSAGWAGGTGGAQPRWNWKSGLGSFSGRYSVTQPECGRSFSCIVNFNHRRASSQRICQKNRLEISAGHDS